MFYVMVYFVTICHSCLLRSKMTVIAETCSKVKGMFDYEYAHTEWY
jgi:hypothetical protein